MVRSRFRRPALQPQRSSAPGYAISLVSDASTVRSAFTTRRTATNSNAHGLLRASRSHWSRARDRVRSLHIAADGEPVGGSGPQVVKNGAGSGPVGPPPLVASPDRSFPSVAFNLPHRPDQAKRNERVDNTVL